jgi:hypothetical protein
MKYIGVVFACQEIVCIEKQKLAMRLGEGSVIPTRKHQLFPTLPKYLKIKKGSHFHDPPLDYSMVPKPGFEPGQAYTH